MGISDFKEMLSRHKKIVENEFKERSESGRAWFNNEKFGVRSVRLTKDISFMICTIMHKL